MKKVEVMKLMAEIQENYPTFDTSDENIERHFRYLSDFDFNDALKNVQTHIKTNDYPPKISHIRGNLADTKNGEASKLQAQEYTAKLNSWHTSSKPPQVGYWDELKKKLRGGHDEQN